MERADGWGRMTKELKRQGGKARRSEGGREEDFEGDGKSEKSKMWQGKAASVGRESGIVPECKRSGTTVRARQAEPVESSRSGCSRFALDPLACELGGMSRAMGRK